jgi:putative pyruvate formate lyase activating enzyme
MKESLSKCIVCPHSCKIDRYKNSNGFCQASFKVKIALASVHNFEEPCISGDNGSGTVFFSNCNLRCVYCQNFKISQNGYGREVTIEELSAIFLKQQNKGVHNINLVSPTIYVPQIIEALKLAKIGGLKIPVVYNSSGYESIETIKKLNGYVDVYLPDFKYINDDIAFKYSGIKNYSSIAQEAILEMYKQVGIPVLDDCGIIKRGLIIRHLILPNNVENSIGVIKWINDNIGKDVYLSIMAQFFPTYNASKFEELNRKININENKKIEDYLYQLSIENGYIQELGDHEEEYVPNFDLSD